MSPRWPLTALLVMLCTAVACSGDGEGDRRAADPPTATRPATTEASTTTGAPTTPTTSAAEAVAAGLCPELPPPATPDPSRPRYTARVDARPAEGIVEGELTVRFVPDLDTDRLIFRLWPNAPRPAQAGVVLTTGPVTQSGGAGLASATPDPTTLEVELGRMLRAGRRIEVTVPWRLIVPGSVPDRVSRSDDSLRLGSFLPLLAWEPGVGWAREPATSAFAESATSPAADYDVAVAVPEGYQVLATGTPGADGRWRAVGVRDFGMSVGRFETATATVDAPEPVAVTVGVHQGIGEPPGAYLDRVANALRDFSARFGPYPWPSFTLAVTPGLRGGIEFPTHVMQGPGTIGRTTPHEVGHQWFYALVGNNQGRDPWMDEGLASWAESRHDGTLPEFQARTLPASARGHAGEPMTFWEGQRAGYYEGVYVQGAVALSALGPPDLVDCALRHYVAAHAYDVARPVDLVASVQTVFPDAAASLAPFGVHP